MEAKVIDGSSPSLCPDLNGREEQTRVFFFIPSLAGFDAPRRAGKVNKKKSIQPV